MTQKEVLEDSSKEIKRRMTMTHSTTVMFTYNQ